MTAAAGPLGGKKARNTKVFHTGATMSFMKIGVSLPERLVAFGDKALAANPNSIPALILLSNFYVDDSKTGSVTKAASYAQKVIELAKADAPDADRSRKLSAGVAHSTLGYALMKQDKTAAAVPQLKSATELLKGQDDTAYAAALYRLGYAYAKLGWAKSIGNRVPFVTRT